MPLLYTIQAKDQMRTLYSTTCNKTRLNHYHLLDATLGKINLSDGNYKKAKDFFLKTLGQPNFQAEKIFIKKMIDKTEAKEKQDIKISS